MFVDRLQIVINQKKYFIIIASLLLIIIVSLINENALLNKFTYKLSTNQIKEGINIPIPAQEKNGYITLISLDNICEKYIINKNIKFIVRNDRLIKIFSDKQKLDNCQFNIVVFKKHPNPFLPLFLVYIPTITILYLLFKMIVNWFRKKGDNENPLKAKTR